jgi:hypothetical protein
VYHVLVSTTERRTPALLDFRSDKAGRSHEGVRQRLVDFLVLNQGSGTFLDHTTVVAQAQDGLSPDLVMDADYLATAAGPPIFSTAFVEATAAALAGDLAFHRYVVRCHGQELREFVVAKT